MTSGEMAEAKSETHKKYSCACGLSQYDRKRPFTGKCSHCHTRPKYLRSQSSFDSRSASRGVNGAAPSNSDNLPITIPTENSSPSTISANSLSTSQPSDSPSCPPPINGLSSASNLSTRSLSTATSTVPQTTSASELNRCNSATIVSSTTEELTTPSIATIRRRSRSVDRYDILQLMGDPPPYQPSTDNSRSTVSNRDTSQSGTRRTASEDAANRRGTRVSTPPPSYEAAQNPNPPSYEEALASSLSGLSTSQGLSALIAITPDLRSSLTTSTGRQSSLLAHQSSLLDSHRVVQRSTQREGHRRSTLRQTNRELQIERDRQRDREIAEEERRREMQVAQYCGCSKCQSLYYSYYYDNSMNDSAFPMETQVIMQEVLADGLAFCSIM